MTSHATGDDKSRSMRLAKGVAPGIVLCSATVIIVVPVYKSATNIPSGVLVFILILLAGTLAVLPVAIRRRRRGELARTTMVPIPNCAGNLCLLAYDTVGAPKLFCNLLRRKPNSEIVWTADLPHASDDQFESYVHAEIDGHEIVANTWRGWRVILDTQSGTIISTTFTK